MQRARRSPVAGRGLLALVAAAALALGVLLLPAAAAASPASPASAATGPAARHHRAAPASPTTRQVARSNPTAGHGDAVKTGSPGPVHLAATPPTATGLDVRAPRAAPGGQRADAFSARPARTTSSRAPPAGPLTQPPVRPAAL